MKREMKRILPVLLIAICVIAGRSYAQGYGYAEEMNRNMNMGNSTTRILLSAYTSTTKDTTVAYNVTQFKSVFVTLQSKDSCDLYLKYQLSLDGGATWGVATTKDSLTTATDAGDVKVMDLSAQIGGCTTVRFIIEQNGLYKLGTTTAKYTAVLTRRIY
jgi:hypothetical protein